VPDVMSFGKAVEKTRGKSRKLLLGNGFSIKYFYYKTLLDRSGLPGDDPLRALFAELGTNDFESVIRALEDASVVEAAYKNPPRSKTFKDDAERLRTALVQAVRATHPANRDDIADAIPSCLRFLRLFDRIFTLNYDLLLYWVILGDTKAFQDGFGLGQEANGFRGPFRPDAHCNVYNMHGGLHLFRTETGEVEKRLMGSTGVIDAIAETITQDKRLPIYVAEGTSIKKLRKINSTPYLGHCYDRFSSSRGCFFVYGHSADQNDAHIYRALFTSQIEHLYFCIHLPTADVNAIDGELARYKALHGSQLQYSFVDSESAQVWKNPLDAQPPGSGQTAGHG
jgi:hypothetical protein